MKKNELLKGREGETLIREKPYSPDPSNRVSCADCGTYDILHGPVDFKGRKSNRGDMTCKKCLTLRKKNLLHTNEQTK